MIPNTRNLQATANTAPEIHAHVVLWRQTIWLLIPLVVLSWQYAMRQVVLFCALTLSRERNRLARELHDILSHTLSELAIELEGLQAMLRLDVERANVLLSHSLQAIREGLTETRRALKELRFGEHFVSQHESFRETPRPDFHAGNS